MNSLEQYISEKLHLNKGIKMKPDAEWLYAVFMDSDGAVHYWPSTTYKTPWEFEAYIQKKFKNDGPISGLEIFDNSKDAQKYELEINSKTK